MKFLFYQLENQPSVAFKTGGAAPIVSQPNANPPNERV
jgi:hypothetical protein